MYCTGVITKAVHKSSEEEKKEEEVKKTLEQHDNIVTQYKELIREQVTCSPRVVFSTTHDLFLFYFFYIWSCWCLITFLVIFLFSDITILMLIVVWPSGCSDPGVERKGRVHDISEWTVADHNHPAAVPDPAAQRPVQHPQAKIR